MNEYKFKALVDEKWKKEQMYNSSKLEYAKDNFRKALRVTNNTLSAKKSLFGHPEPTFGHSNPTIRHPLIIMACENQLYLCPYGLFGHPDKKSKSITTAPGNIRVLGLYTRIPC